MIRENEVKLNPDLTLTSLRRDGHLLGGEVGLAQLGHHDAEHAVLELGGHLLQVGVARQSDSSSRLAEGALQGVHSVGAGVVISASLCQNDEAVVLRRGGGVVVRDCSGHRDLQLVHRDTGQVAVDEVGIRSLDEVEAHQMRASPGARGERSLGDPHHLLAAMLLRIQQPVGG
eukprot:CAMPEP_0173203174 /NCGR_PEP_ID=MMETSP1141-20130122/19375_1 /TAXON_ID=483371 /ORGANISM="non described non described, Strain CCMP2298" /LENGTH=172 /DNA_ID=CAMNT_0014128607 /DNA_START=64 /DNA_END=578 /DNA_ORIENTATION=+